MYASVFDSESKDPGACVIADETLVVPVNVLIKALNAEASATVSPAGPLKIVMSLIVNLLNLCYLILIILSKLNYYYEQS